MKQPRDYALLMLRKAANDLIAADATLQTGMAFDTVGFHAQQAVEKSLKAILSFNDIEYRRTHDLTQLLTLVLDVDHDLARLGEQILPLTRFAVEIRYSDENELFEHEAVEAFNAAEEIYRFTVRYLGIGHEQPEDWYLSEDDKTT